MTEKNNSFNRFGKQTILIVDDVAKNVQVLGNLLSEFDYQLVVAMSGRQALDTLARIKPDLILLDIMMPEIDGFEVCRQLKNLESTRDIPVIFLTAKTDAEDIVKGFELGAVDYITKPFVRTELLARVKTHLSLKKTKEQLFDEIAAKNKFFSIISHELRGSFSVILGFVKIMQEYRDTLSETEVSDLINELGSNAKSTFELLENLLYWARMQTTGIRIKAEKLPAYDLVEQIIKTLKEIAHKKDIKIISGISPGNIIFADDNMIQTIIRNLVSNAIKFSHRGETITISSEVMGNQIKISVTDTGVGIYPDKIDTLFRIDAKVTTLGTENEKGSGLGLVLCKEFVELNQGEIGIESEVGKGTTVWIKLPGKEHDIISPE